jgi:hypothetical protein
MEFISHRAFNHKPKGQAWLILSLAYSWAMLGRQNSLRKVPTNTHLDVASLVKNKKLEIESDPELKQSLNKLNQLLKNS